MENTKFVDFTNQPTRAFKIDALTYLKINAYHTQKSKTALIDRVCSVQVQEYGALVSGEKLGVDGETGKPKLTVVKAGLRLSLGEQVQLKKRLELLYGVFAKLSQKGKDAKVPEIMTRVFGEVLPKYGYNNNPVMPIQETNGLTLKVLIRFFFTCVRPRRFRSSVDGIVP